MGGLKEGYFRVGGGKYLGIKGVGLVDFFFFHGFGRNLGRRLLN